MKYRYYVWRARTGPASFGIVFGVFQEQRHERDVLLFCPERNGTCSDRNYFYFDFLDIARAGRAIRSVNPFVPVYPYWYDKLVMKALSPAAKVSAK